MNYYKDIKNAERDFAFCGESSSSSGAKGKISRELFFIYISIIKIDLHSLL